VLEILNVGYEVIVIDNLCNSNRESIMRVEEITGKRVTFYEIDIRDSEELRKIFRQHSFDAVIHFAGLKAVGESVAKPDIYYDSNVIGSLRLFNVMNEFAVRTIVFSSSATVYGDPSVVPIKETMPAQRPTNTYGRTKLMIEDILRDYAYANKDWNVCLLRYFNPVGAHQSGRIGENPSGIPNNLVPYISQVAVGKLDTLSVFGDDYDTPDGTGVRDYIHVVDLALGHIAALRTHQGDHGVHLYNLGTGKGSSVFEVLKAFEVACGKKLSYVIKPRREGDIATCFADPTLANEKLQWSAKRSLEEMMVDTWRWQSANPNGFEA
jgi:UDP-glucose 4-epimerase